MAASLPRPGISSSRSAAGSALVEGTRDAAIWFAAFEHVRGLSDQTAEDLARLDVDAEYDAARALLVEASEIAPPASAGRETDCAAARSAPEAT
jgi:hypothetical protein